MDTPTLKSSFAVQLEGFIAHKRAIGYRYNASAAVLRRFDDFCYRHHGNDAVLSREIVSHWAERASWESDGSRAIRITPIRQFARYLNSHGREAYVLPDRMFPAGVRYIPYIFSDEELVALFSAADQCPHRAGSDRYLVMPLLFRILYCCGLRVGEATALKRRHVDLGSGVFTIKAGKYDKDRNVPMALDLAERCRRFDAVVHGSSDPDSFFLKGASDGRPIHRATVYGNFRIFLWNAGISHGGKGHGPRVHDLRHTFAVHCLRRWVEQGKDLSAYLPILKTYLGHASYRETAYYLRLTADLYPSITRSVEQEIGQVLPPVGGLQ
jgi:integrase/recombinase XerD